MVYYFDTFGILSAEPIEGRSTEVAPPDTPLPAGCVWRWDGYAWTAFDPTPPVPPPPPPEPEWAWFIDIGPFFDRFGAAKMSVLTSADVGVQAILKDIQVRKWIDLKLPEVAQSLAYVGSKVPAVTQALQTAILSTKPAPGENLALRKLYFSA